MRSLGRLAVTLAVLTLALTGCYLPTRFTADIQIGGAGDYTLDYVGAIANAPLLTALADGLGPAEEKERAADVVADLRRDSGFQEVSYLGGGQFAVRYHRTGNLQRQPAITFVRSDSRILTVTYVREEETVTVRGGTVPAVGRERIRALGLDIRGVLRVHTEHPVADHNAGEVTDGARRSYVWQISGVDTPAPRLIIR